MAGLKHDSKCERTGPVSVSGRNDNRRSFSANACKTELHHARSSMRSVAILALDTVVPVDLAIPVGVFSHARLASGKPAYEVKVCGPTKTITVDAGFFRMAVPHGLHALSRADTIIVPGVGRLDDTMPAVALDALRRAARRGARIASICSGAFVLARAGLLDGRRATTHWIAVDDLKKRHPSVDVDPDVLYVDTGRIMTSAGAMAGIDLCLHIVRKDCGAAVAADSARLAVMPLERSGGQAQFITHAPPATAGGESLADTLEWMQRNLKRELGVPHLARRARMSPRTFARRFHEQTGATPARWVALARVRAAQALLETTALSVEGVADAVGFRSAVAFRARFRRVVGVSPAEYRRAFKSRQAA